MARRTRQKPTAQREVTAYRHLVRLPADATVDPRPGRYYVSVIDPVTSDDSDPRNRKMLALGPFDTHAQALSLVDAFAAWANEQDARAAFFRFGTARLRDDDTGPVPQGRFNAELSDLLALTASA